ncbi:hypothetical protein AVEN_53889-1, partial [Araneus ventricosus]
MKVISSRPELTNVETTGHREKDQRVPHRLAAGHYICNQKTGSKSGSKFTQLKFWWGERLCKS